MLSNRLDALLYKLQAKQAAISPWGKQNVTFTFACEQDQLANELLATSERQSALLIALSRIKHELYQEKRAKVNFLEESTISTANLSKLDISLSQTNNSAIPLQSPPIRLEFDYDPGRLKVDEGTQVALDRTMEEQRKRMSQLSSTIDKIKARIGELDEERMSKRKQPRQTSQKKLRSRAQGRRAASQLKKPVIR